MGKFKDLDVKIQEAKKMGFDFYCATHGLTRQIEPCCLRAVDLKSPKLGTAPTVDLCFEVRVRVPAEIKTNEILSLGASLEEILVNGTDVEFSDVVIVSSTITRRD